MTSPARNRKETFPGNQAETGEIANSIRLGLARHLHDSGFQIRKDGSVAPTANTKEGFRSVHAPQRRERLLQQANFIRRKWPKLQSHFADGEEVSPSDIAPRLELIKSDTWQSDLFRLAALTWSVPVSQGYGRRLRFLVWDSSNEKLIGLIALGDPVFNLRARDDLIGWSVRYRKSRLVNLMDAYVLGAVPPYNFLLGGKLVASLVRTREVRRAFQRKYGNRRGVISKRKKHASLVLVTTTSALGKSSVLDRLRIDGVQYFKSVGFSKGWGTFHVPRSLFELMRQFLVLHGHKYADGHQFGDGPNWKLRVARKTLGLLGISEKVLNHGVPREVFLCWLASNGKTILKSRDRPRPDLGSLQSVEKVATLAKARWVVPRSARRPEYRSWTREQLAQFLLGPEEGLVRTDDNNRTGAEVSIVAS